MGTLIVILLLVLFVGVPILIYKQARKQFRLRNLQLKDLERRERERRGQPSAPAPLPPGWYADPSGTGGSRYWDGARWTSAS